MSVCSVAKNGGTGERGFCPQWALVVGMGAAMAVYGVGLWGAPFMLAAAVPDASWPLYGVAGLAGTVAGSWAQPARMFLSDSATAAEGSWSFAVLAVSLTLLGLLPWFCNPVLLMVVGAVLGFSLASLFLFWMGRFAKMPPRVMGRMLAASLLVAAAFHGLVLVLGSASAMPVGCWAAGALTVACGVLACRFGAGPTGRATARQPHADDYRKAARAITVPLACAVALLVVIPMAHYVALGDALGWPVRTLNICLAQIAASLAVAVLTRLSKAQSLMAAVYTWTMPVLVVLLFVVPFAGKAAGMALLLVGSCLFFVVTACIMMDCARAARSHRVDPRALYGVCAGVLYLTRYIGEQVMRGVSQSELPQDVQMLAAAFFVMYVLGLVFLVVRGRRQAATEKALGAVAAGDDSGASVGSAAPWGWGSGSPEMRCWRFISDSNGLSEREAEVLLKLLRGRNAPIIAEELCVSQNTVRTHMKKIYRTLNVHSRKELLERFEAELANFA